MDKPSTLQLDQEIAKREHAGLVLTAAMREVTKLITKTQDRHARTMIENATRLISQQIPCTETKDLATDEGSTTILCDEHGSHELHKAAYGGFTLTWGEVPQAAESDDEVDSEA